MAERIAIGKGQELRLAQPEVEQKARKTGDRTRGSGRVMIAVITGVVLAALTLVVLLKGSFGAPTKEQGREALIRREKALRDREDAAPSPAQSAPQVPVATGNTGD